MTEAFDREKAPKTSRFTSETNHGRKSRQQCRNLTQFCLSAKSLRCAMKRDNHQRYNT